MSKQQQTQEQLSNRLFFRSVAAFITIVAIVIGTFLAIFWQDTALVVSLLLAAFSDIGLLLPLIRVPSLDIRLPIIPFINYNRIVEKRYLDYCQVIVNHLPPQKCALVVRTDREWLGLYTAISAWVKGKRPFIPPERVIEDNRAAGKNTIYSFYVAIFNNLEPGQYVVSGFANNYSDAANLCVLIFFK